MPVESVKITKDGEEAYVAPSAAATYERHGWTVEDDGSSEAPKKAAAKKTEKEG